MISPIAPSARRHPRTTNIPVQIEVKRRLTALSLVRKRSALPLLLLPTLCRAIGAQTPNSSPRESVAPATSRAKEDIRTIVQRNRIVEFLNTSEELRKSFSCRFTGQLHPIPDELQSELRQSLPMCKFYIARMKVLIDPPSDTFDVKLITDAVTGTVLGYVWDVYWILQPSASFESILKGRQAKTRDEAVNTVRSLAKLIAYSSKSKVGAVKGQRGRMKVELLAGNKVFGILEVRINSQLKFDRVAITGPDGKRIRYFA